ncbi:DUF262 domain-containing protein [Mesorhizobium sp. WSM4308]|uniref:DUF262 domain-containing protein n=1 Tax=Mesorhizobium sp. WSM4308 TaxID=2029409 RepID=UPI0015CA573D|nr:DUF262 domain-containing protein [Mesorhizobium sp. WSM4308]
MEKHFVQFLSPGTFVSEMTASRKMPERINLGRHFASVMASPMMQLREWKENPRGVNPLGLRTVMGYCLPTWQRGLVWSDAQKISFIESAWRGISLGTYTYNQADMGSPFDNLLIDGQQRLYAIQCYLNDDFPVFGWHWSEVTVVDRRVWEMTVHFNSYVTNTEDESYLRGYYNLMNFGGVAHKESERA